MNATLVPIDQFLPGVQRFLKGVPSTTARFAVLETAIDFLRRTRLWEEKDTLVLTTASNDVQVTPPDPNTEILEIMHIALNGEKIPVASEVWMDDTYPYWRDTATTGVMTGTPERYVQQSIDFLTFIPIDNVMVTLDELLIPAASATQLPDFLFRFWRSGIEAGAIYKLLLMPNQPWTETYRGYGLPAVSDKKQMEYEAEVARGCKQKARGVQRAPMRTRGVYY
jgi:hypothetical protein